MLFHVSIAARDPARVAAVLAELWDGDALPFPPVAQGSWIALAGDDRGSAIEVYPAGTVLRESAGDADATSEQREDDGFTAAHVALATPFYPETVLGIARREGWPAKYRRRGGVFGVIELWVEGTQMVEVLTPEMQAEYVAGMTPANWRRMLAEMAPAA